MRPISQILWQIVLSLGLMSSVLAQSEISSIQIPDAYSVGRAPANIAVESGFRAASSEDGSADASDVQTGQAAATEDASTLNGTLYAVIAPTFDGSNVTTSFFRFVNGGAASSQFSVSVVGSPSGDSYGTALIDVPTRASPQYSLSGLRTLAGAPGLENGDTSFALYMQNTDPASGYQHVIFNNDNSFFENASICGTTFEDALSAVANSKVLINVHTSLLAPWPSQIEIHNFWNAPVTYTVTIVEAVTGTVMGQVNVDTEANSS